MYNLACADERTLNLMSDKPLLFYLGSGEWFSSQNIMIDVSVFPFLIHISYIFFA